MKTKINIGIIDDHFLFLEGLTALLSDFSGFTVLFACSNTEEAIQQMKNTKPDVLLLDIDMPKIDGIETLKLIRKWNNNIKPIILTSYKDEELICHFLQMGARSFLHKISDTETLAHAIREVHERGYYFNDMVTEALIGVSQSEKGTLLKDTEARLTERETEIVKLICLELTTKEIADKLNISARTVDGHRDRILEKTGAKNIAGIVMYAMRQNIV